MSNSTSAEIKRVLREWLAPDDPDWAGDPDTKTQRHATLVWIGELEEELEAYRKENTRLRAGAARALAIIDQSSRRGMDRAGRAKA